MSVVDGQLIPTYEEVIWERTTESKMSTVISLLPVSLQSRMSPFRSSRRTASLGNLRMDGGGRLVCTSATTPTKPRPLSASVGADMAAIRGAASSGAVTPGSEGGEERARSGTVTPTMDVVMASGAGARGSRADSASGINWRYANQGTNLVGIAAEASVESQTRDFERKAFVDGLSYLLKALPTNLDVYESEQIRSSLPSYLHSNMPDYGPARTEAVPGDPYHQHYHHHHQPPGHDHRSLLHRSVQHLVVNIFLFTHFILPYLIHLVKSLAVVERRYKVSETVVGHGVTLASAAGRQCSHLAGAVLNMNDGRVGQGLSRVVAWMVEEVTRGISDGVGEGLVVTRLK